MFKKVRLSKFNNHITIEPVGGEEANSLGIGRLVTTSDSRFIICSDEDIEKSKGRLLKTVDILNDESKEIYQKYCFNISDLISGIEVLLLDLKGVNNGVDEVLDLVDCRLSLLKRYEGEFGVLVASSDSKLEDYYNCAFSVNTLLYEIEDLFSNVICEDDISRKKIEYITKRIASIIKYEKAIKELIKYI